MNTALIPTDFSVNSLHLVKQALENRKDEQTDILLLYAHQLTDSITDLLFFSKTRTLRSLTNPDFEEACSMLKNKYEGTLNSIRTDLFMGFNQQAFNSYLESNKVGAIYLPENGTMKIDRLILKFAKKSKTAVVQVELPERTIPVQASPATQLFHI
jgi:hypothetical protein